MSILGPSRSDMASWQANYHGPWGSIPGFDLRFRIVPFASPLASEVLLGDGSRTYTVRDYVPGRVI